jgi:hypothetical protein
VFQFQPAQRACLGSKRVSQQLAEFRSYLRRVSGLSAFPFRIRSVLKCQRIAATQLLKRKYGVNPSKGQWQWVDEEWQAWLAVLGKAPAKFRESFLTMRTFLGCGLAEYAALYLVPALRNRYFATMSGVLLAAGCFQSLSLAKRRWEPMWASLTRLLLLLMEELAETRWSRRWTRRSKRDNDHYG